MTEEGADNIYYDVPEDEFKTSNVIQKSEYARVLAIRAQQISESHITTTYGLTDHIAIARKELKDGKCPLTVIREIPSGDKIVYIEVWKVREMTIPEY